MRNHEIARLLAAYMTVAEAAYALGVSKPRVEQFIRGTKTMAPRLVVEFEAGGLRWVSRAAVARLKKTPRTPGRPPHPHLTE